MKTIRYEHLNETIVETTLAGRLKTSYIHKPGFSKTYVALSLPLGATHQGYLDETNAKTITNRGIAHFLEHKVFEKNGTDVSKDFSLKEAQINAFTEHHQTTYLFHATNHLIDNIVRLVDMVFFPEFTTGGIEKEKNIIKEELNMHLDDPYYLQYQATLQAMYHNHPVKDDILGDNDAIASMNIEELRNMHAAYYQPEYAHLVILGAAEPETILKTLKETIRNLPQPTLKKPLPPALDEPETVKNKSTELFLDVMMPSVLFGVKITPHGGEKPLERIKDKFALSLLMDLLLGKSGKHYADLLDRGLINDSFGLEIAYEPDHAYVLIGSETQHPEALKQALLEIFDALKVYEPDNNAFLRQKRQMVGNFLSGLDHLESLSYHFNEYLRDNLYFYDVLEIANTIELSHIKAQTGRIKSEHITTTLVKPKKQTAL